MAMNTVTRYAHRPPWRYLVTVDHWHTEPKGAQWNFSTAQAVQDFIVRNFPGMTFRWDVRHAENCPARLRRGQCDCEIPEHDPACSIHSGGDCDCVALIPSEQLDTDRHENARHDCFMESALEPHDEPLG